MRMTEQPLNRISDQILNNFGQVTALGEHQGPSVACLRDGAAGQTLSQGIK